MVCIGDTLAAAVADDKCVEHDFGAQLADGKKEFDGAAELFGPTNSDYHGREYLGKNPKQFAEKFGAQPNGYEGPKELDVGGFNIRCEQITRDEFKIPVRGYHDASGVKLKKARARWGFCHQSKSFKELTCPGNSKWNDWNCALNGIAGVVGLGIGWESPQGRYFSLCVCACVYLSVSVCMCASVCMYVA